MKHLGKEIAARRKERKLSLRQAAELVDLSHQAVNNAEHGLTGFESSLKIAKALGTSKDRLVELAKLDAEDLARNV